VANGTHRSFLGLQSQTKGRAQGAQARMSGGSSMVITMRRAFHFGMERSYPQAGRHAVDNAAHARPQKFR
jgi:hypothetical protein